MDLYVIRHAIAEERSAFGRDQDRALTARGRSRFHHVVLQLERHGVRFESLRTSPWLRARQTASLLGSLAEEIVVCPTLARDPDPELLSTLGPGTTGVVGHQPWLGDLVAWLAVGSQSAGHAFRLAKGSVVHLRGEPEPGGMVVRALVTPKWTRAGS